MNLLNNPFFLLGATVRDNRQRIVELADEKSLTFVDPTACSKLRGVLTHPRARLTAEVAWLPGVAPARASKLLGTLQMNPIYVVDPSSLPTLAAANVLASALPLMPLPQSEPAWSSWLIGLAILFDRIDGPTVAAEINEDRAVSGFPTVTGQSAIEEELSARRNHYRTVMRDALNRLPTEMMVNTINQAVDIATNRGKSHAPILLDDLVDSYRVETQNFLEREAANVATLIEVVKRQAVSRGASESTLRVNLDKLEAVVKNWDRVAQPIQLSLSARGLEHEESVELANELRQLAVHLHNEHGLTSSSERVTRMIHETFAEHAGVAAQAKEDLGQLANLIAEKRRATEEDAERRHEWAREIFFDGEVGVLFKDRLRISEAGLQYKSMVFPLDKVTHILWGGTRHSVYGIPTGSTFNVMFGDGTRTVDVELRDRQKFLTFTDKLWRAVGVRLMLEMCASLKRGERVTVGDAVLQDEGVWLLKRDRRAGIQRVYRPWTMVCIGNIPGNFFIAAVDDSEIYVCLEYLTVFNVHILEAAIRWLLKEPRSHKLSELLE